MVCTHGSRDIRCSVLGEPLVETLHSLSASQDLYKEGVVGGVYRCSHIGGHAYAGNVLCFSTTAGGKLQLRDWLGGVNAQNVEQVLQALAALARKGDVGSEELLRSDVLRPLWRGRMGLEEDAQRAVHSAACEACGKKHECVN